MVQTKTITLLNYFSCPSFLKIIALPWSYSSMLIISLTFTWGYQVLPSNYVTTCLVCSQFLQIDRILASIFIYFNFVPVFALWGFLFVFSAPEFMTICFLFSIPVPLSLFLASSSPTAVSLLLPIVSFTSD